MTTWTVLGRVSLSAVPESVGQARRFVADVLGDTDRTATAQLLISEACTNSVKHSDSRHGGSFTLTLFDCGSSLRCEVIDAGGPTLPARRQGTDLRDHGHGIVLIEALAVRSGYDIDESGRLHTWFELT
ncbi:ATP-binding protein [Actinomadura sp. 6K520]|uniref:ATP-binding protein n=1 Tax=Actinomadura sp. 6K520 TaxID=2530364 RepID=UPI0014051D51|nr:ATP-binding protein [Actinomadura sp. 6K520]